MNFQYKMFENIILSKPKVTPVSFLALTKDFYIGTGAIQGWRTTFEDAHTIIVSKDKPSAYFAVFDGHGGHQVADMVSKKLHEFIAKEEKKTPDFKKALESAFVKLDMYMLQNFQKAMVMGSTALGVFIRGQTVYCANLGDCRAVAYVKNKAQELSTDHRLDLEEERMRVLDAEGFICNNRIYGRLVPTRSFGDFVFKQNPGKSLQDQAVTAFPEVREFSLEDDWEFIVIACDGIWEVMDSGQVCTFVKDRIVKQEDPLTICLELMLNCLSKAQNPEFEAIGQDNMTVILILLRTSDLERHLHPNIEPVTELKYICDHRAFKKIK